MGFSSAFVISLVSTNEIHFRGFVVFGREDSLTAFKRVDCIQTLHSNINTDFCCCANLTEISKGYQAYEFSRVRKAYEV